MNHELEGIAVVGIAGRFPGAADADALWHNVVAGRESIRRFSDEELATAGVPRELSAAPLYVKARPLIDDVKGFDAECFAMTTREAEITDPQLRLLMECAHEALEQAGQVPGDDLTVGVYAGVRLSRYLDEHLLPNPDVVRSVGIESLQMINRKDSAATLLSYRLDLTGPSISLNTACSTGLVAVHLGCGALLNHECDLVLAGSAAIPAFDPEGYLHTPGGILSPDGHCRPFDQAAKGTLDGAGVGVVALMRLEDAVERGVPVLAVIRGTSVNNDGAIKIGYTAPSVDGQARVIAEAMATAGVGAETIGYVETHGTATPLGDPIEIAALTQAFRLDTDRVGFCGISSLKSNIGHLGAAAGIAGLIKAVQAVRHGVLPPSLNFESPNPELRLADSPFYVIRDARPWPADRLPRRASVSSFGIGGTNAHLILEQAPDAAAAPQADAGTPRARLLPFSATSEAGLADYARRLAAVWRAAAPPSLDAAARTLQHQRRARRHRGFVVAADAAEAVREFERLAARAAPAEGADRPGAGAPPVVLQFTGQGAQQRRMGGLAALAQPRLAARLDEAARWLREDHGVELAVLVADGHDPRSGLRLDTTAGAQPALFALEWALGRFWLDAGITPAALVGHSLGELVAATLANVMSLRDALRLVMARGAAMQQAPVGAMLAVPLAETALAALLAAAPAEAGTCVISAVNGPAACVVSGSLAGIAALEALLAAQRTVHKRLDTSHAFHSPLMEPVLERFRAAFDGITLRAPELPVHSTVTGRRLTDAEAIDPAYWVGQLRAPVRYQQALQAALADLAGAAAVVLELGPGRTLTSAARGFVEARHTVLPSLGGTADDEARALLQAFGQLWSLGVRLDWSVLDAAAGTPLARLPTMPFTRRRAWIERFVPTAAPAASGAILPDAAPAGAAAPLSVSVQPTDEGLPMASPEDDGTAALHEQLTAIWRDALGDRPIGPDDSFFDLGGNSLLALQVVGRINQAFGVAINPADMLMRPTVAELSDVITGKLLGKTDDADLDALLNEMSQLSDDDVRELLKQA
ncbi:type I polyketide synthase [Burkholderia plantarii]|uniref:Polyketide synthase type I n=1 Tax=Burkholderia plantarii TaxID=41899 RepID=A0A0B6RXS3_BURPL|nr:type I polyketide synthase [Burkholderia plantarii]AJK48198.1 polyketide synthase type I [Burkholderia plantarii]